MKLLIVLIAIIGVAVYFGAKVLDQGLSTQHFDVFVAFDEPSDEATELHVALTAGMTERESPDGSTQYNSTWQNWMEAHFELLDEDGNPVTIKYLNKSKLIGAKPGSPDVGFLSAAVVTGQSYTLRYTPVRTEPIVAEGRFTAPDRRRDPYVLKMIEQKP